MDKVNLGKNGGKNGDLFININIEKDKRFRIDGCNLYTYLYIQPWESALGTKTRIEGIDEEEIVCIPKGMQSGEKIKIQGKGYKDSKGGRGDLIAEIRIVVPKNLSQTEIEIYERLKELSKYTPKQK